MEAEAEDQSSSDCLTKVIVLFPNAINDVAVSWLPRWVEVVDSRTIEQDGSFDVVITWGLLDLVERISHLTCPTRRATITSPDERQLEFPANGGRTWSLRRLVHEVHQQHGLAGSACATDLQSVARPLRRATLFPRCASSARNLIGLSIENSPGLSSAPTP